jgi:hypothetical protein
MSLADMDCYECVFRPWKFAAEKMAEQGAKGSEKLKKELLTAIQNAIWRAKPGEDINAVMLCATSDALSGSSPNFATAMSLLSI